MGSTVRDGLETVAWSVAALLAALLVFGAFVAAGGRNPVEAWKLLALGAFGDWFSWQNTLQRAAPLMLTALCVAIPAQAGLVIIGGEGALVLGGLAAAAAPYPAGIPGGVAGSALVLTAGALAGAAWIALAGFLRQARGVNETISSLLLSYIAIALFKHLVEGPMRDPASLNKPSTLPLPESIRIGGIFDSDVHWGLAWGLGAALLLGAGLYFTSAGFAVRVSGGNVRAARLVGLAVDRLVIGACAIGGACAGLAGAIEVAAVHTAANASLIAGFGYAGILVSFVARHNPIAVVPVAILFGGFGAAGSMLQRRMGLPDASVVVLQGFAFVFVLASEALRGRVPWSRLLAVTPPGDSAKPGASVAAATSAG
ncbi:MAG TPA: ABC transporter permease [Burkholderiaceae bacterium]|nr:ABC transporter permease [Burkholderiaceae bacterium]